MPPYSLSAAGLAEVRKALLAIMEKRTFLKRPRFLSCPAGGATECGNRCEGR